MAHVTLKNLTLINMNIIRIIKLPFVILSLSAFIATSLFGATKYINYTGNTDTELYKASNWSSYSGGSPTNYTIDGDGLGQPNAGDVIQLRVRGDANTATTAEAPATSNATSYTLDGLNIGDFGTAYAKIDSGDTLNTRNTSVGHVTNNSAVAGDGTLYVSGTKNVSNAFITGHQAKNNTTNNVGVTGHTVIQNGGVINAANNAVIGQANNSANIAPVGIITIETGGTLYHDATAQGGEDLNRNGILDAGEDTNSNGVLDLTGGSTNGFVIGRDTGSTATLNMNGGTANIYTLSVGDQNTARTGQTVNLNMNDGAIYVQGWINGQANDLTASRNLLMDKGVIYIKDNWNASAGEDGQWQGKGGEARQLIEDYFGVGGSNTNLTAEVVNGGLSGTALGDSLIANFTAGGGSYEVTGGTIMYGRDNDVLGSVTNPNPFAGGGYYAIWAVPEPSSYSLIAGILAMTAIMLRRRL